VARQVMKGVQIACIYLDKIGIFLRLSLSGSIRTLVKDNEEIGNSDLLVHLLVYEKFLLDIYN
jgi:hypothetical protein